MNTDKLFFGVQALVNLPHFVQLCNSLPVKAIFILILEKKVLLIHVEFGFNHVNIK